MSEASPPSDPNEIFPLTQRECEIVGYVHAWGCNLQDMGIDPRKAYCDELLEEVRVTFQHRSAVKPERDLPLIIAIIFGTMLGSLGTGALLFSWWVAPHCR